MSGGTISEQSGLSRRSGRSGASCILVCPLGPLSPLITDLLITDYLFCRISPVARLGAGDFFVVISDPALTELVLRFFVDDGNGMDGQCL